MTRRMLAVSAGAAALGLLLILWSGYRYRAARPAPPQRSPFARSVDLTPLGGIAVYEQGRGSGDF